MEKDAETRRRGEGAKGNGVVETQNVASLRRWVGGLVGDVDRADVFFGVGLVCGAVGFGAVYWPLGFIFLGLVLTGLGIAGAMK